MRLWFWFLWVMARVLRWGIWLSWDVFSVNLNVYLMQFLDFFLCIIKLAEAFNHIKSLLLSLLYSFALHMSFFTTLTVVRFIIIIVRSSSFLLIDYHVWSVLVQIVRSLRLRWFFIWKLRFIFARRNINVFCLASLAQCFEVING